ncbi:MAG: roadblock/LC7 domain-containing protein [Promethearchaeia archaeon]
MTENITELTNLLRELQAMNSDITGSSIVSIQGLPICSALPNETNEGIVSAMSAAILSVSERAVEELSRGDLKRVLIEGVDGTVLLSRAGQNAIICVLLQENASLGMVFLHVQSTSKKIALLLD